MSHALQYMKAVRSKSSILHASIYMTCWKRQHCRVRKWIGGCLGSGEGEGFITKGQHKGHSGGDTLSQLWWWL